MAKHHPDLVMCRKQPGIAIGRLCEKCKRIITNLSLNFMIPYLCVCVFLKMVLQLLTSIHIHIHTFLFLCFIILLFAAYMT